MRTFNTLLVAALIAASCFTCACSQKADTNVIKGYDKKNTYFSLTSSDGKKLALEDYAGKPVLVIFLCNDCPDCHNAAPMMKKIDEIYSPKGLTVIGLSWDTTAEPAHEFAQKHKLSFPFALNSEPIAKKYRSRGMPNFYLLDKNHNIAKVWIGENGGDAYVKDMFKTLDEATSQLNPK